MVVEAEIASEPKKGRHALGGHTQTDITKNFYTLFMDGAGTCLGIGQVVERTGLAEATLRVWERRYGFPAPKRLASGHRRYSEDEVELIRAVAAKRRAGLALPVAIEQARSERSGPARSVYAALRARAPDLGSRRLVKPVMLALSRAIEDEALSRGEAMMVFGAFQRERFYRESQPRWRELSRTAEVAVVFADFARPCAPRDAPIEVPVPREHPLNREWAVVCEGTSFALCLAGWEAPGSEPGAVRDYEAIWSVQPDIVREATRVFCAAAAARRPDVADAARARLEAPLTAPPEAQLQLASAVTARMLANVSHRLAQAAK
jgi:DNA-binding transcriptional MerR regulator